MQIRKCNDSFALCFKKCIESMGCIDLPQWLRLIYFKYNLLRRQAELLKEAPREALRVAWDTSSLLNSIIEKRFVASLSSRAHWKASKGYLWNWKLY